MPPSKKRSVKQTAQSGVPQSRTQEDGNSSSASASDEEKEQGPFGPFDEKELELFEEEAEKQRNEKDAEDADEEEGESEEEDEGKPEGQRMRKKGAMKMSKIQMLKQQMRSDVASFKRQNQVLAQAVGVSLKKRDDSPYEWNDDEHDGNDSEISEHALFGTPERDVAHTCPYSPSLQWYNESDPHIERATSPSLAFD